MNWKIKWFEELGVQEMYEILQLRTEVFVVEQNCVYQDLDGKDNKSLHVSGYLNEVLVAYVRIVKAGVSYSEIAIGRVVVSPAHRHKSLGHEVMTKAIEIVESQLGVQPIRISAQSHLEKFYGKLGFVSTGKAYLEDGIPHIEMLRE